MNFEHIIFSIEHSVARISLNRPDVLNSFNRKMALELQDALDACTSNPEVRSVLLTGEGRAFCAGQDLAEAVAANAMSIGDIVDQHYNPIVKKIRGIAKPVVCAVNGVAAGAGANLAIACDIVLASSSSSFIQSFSKIALVPDTGGTFMLPRLIGMQRATALMMLGEKISAQQAFDFGMIYKVVDDNNLQEEAMKMAGLLAQMPTKGLGLTKLALNRSMINNLDEQLEVEKELQAQAGDSYDFKEGVKAFIEKRKPVFKGE